MEGGEGIPIWWRSSTSIRFNKAIELHRRREHEVRYVGVGVVASMGPSSFIDGERTPQCAHAVKLSGFMVAPVSMLHDRQVNIDTDDGVKVITNIAQTGNHLTALENTSLDCISPPRSWRRSSSSGANRHRAAPHVGYYFLGEALRDRLLEPLLIDQPGRHRCHPRPPIERAALNVAGSSLRAA